MSNWINDWQREPEDEWAEDVFFDEEDIELVEEKEIKLDKLQRSVVDTILEGKVNSMYLTGEGGSGKSAIIDQIVLEAGEKKKRVLVLAPTNAAVLFSVASNTCE